MNVDVRNVHIFVYVALLKYAQRRNIFFIKNAILNPPEIVNTVKFAKTYSRKYLLSQ